jgi:hypothetical protein
LKSLKERENLGVLFVNAVNNNMDVREMRCEDMNWIEMALAGIHYGGVHSGSTRNGTFVQALQLLIKSHTSWKL